MTLYVDSSALLKRYVREHDSERAIELLNSDPVLVTAIHTEVEVRRNLARLLDGPDLTERKRDFLIDLDAFALLTVDAVVAGDAAAIVEETGLRTLDALHLAAARRTGERTVLCTFDVRQAQAARSLGIHVVGV